MPYAIYIASVLGGLALFMMMPRVGYSPRKLGALLGAVALGGLWLFLSRWTQVWNDKPGLAVGAIPYYYLFSALGIGSAVRVITHRKPVYAALWFVMVVLASAGLLLVLSAEFVAMAMVIIYGGAILVTYLFVIMLANHAGDPNTPDTPGTPHTPESPDYDRAAREPAAALVAGFLLLAVLLGVIFPAGERRPFAPNPRAMAASDQQIITADLPHRAAARLAQKMSPREVEAMVGTFVHTESLDNVERVGLDLFRSHPLGLELAGVILLAALVGAVVIAKMRVTVAPRTE